MNKSHAEGHQPNPDREREALLNPRLLRLEHHRAPIGRRTDRAKTLRECPFLIEPGGFTLRIAFFTGLDDLRVIGAAGRYYIRNGRNGLLFRAGDVGDLAAKLKQLSSDPLLYQELARHARESVNALDWNVLLAGLYDRMKNIAGP